MPCLLATPSLTFSFTNAELEVSTGMGGEDFHGWLQKGPFLIFEALTPFNNEDNTSSIREKQPFSHIY